MNPIVTPPTAGQDNTKAMWRPRRTFFTRAPRESILPPLIISPRRINFRQTDQQSATKQKPIRKRRDGLVLTKYPRHETRDKHLKVLSASAKVAIILKYFRAESEPDEMSYTIDTNLPSDQIPDDFLSGMSEFLCTLFDRPRKVTMGQLRAGQVFDFSGSTDPCAVMHVIRGFQYPSKVNDEKIERYVAAISEHVENKLGIPKSRLMIFYYHNDLALIANDGKTLKRIWAEIGTAPPAE